MKNTNKKTGPPPTVTKEEVKEYMDAYFLINGTYPSFTAIAKHFPVSRQWIASLVAILHDEGFLTFNKNSTAKPFGRKEYDYRPVCMELGLRIIDQLKEEKLKKSLR